MEERTVGFGDQQTIRITDKRGDKTTHIVETAETLPGGGLRLRFIYVLRDYKDDTKYHGYYPDKKVNTRIIAPGEWLELEFLEDDE